MTTQAENDTRIELGYALAKYIHKYPRSRHDLPHRIAVLTHKRVEEVDETLVHETEYWLDQFAAS